MEDKKLDWVNIGELASQNIDDKPTLVWESIDDPSARLDESTLVVSDFPE